MLEYGGVSHYNPRRRPTCDGASSLSKFLSHGKDVCSVFVLPTKIIPYDMFVILILSLLRVGAVKIIILSALPQIYSWHLFSMSHAQKATSSICTS